MARPAKPWYRKGRDQWCVNLVGKLIVLAKGKSNFNEAFRKFLVLTSPAEARKIPTAKITAKEVIAGFLEFSEVHHKKATSEFHGRFLNTFAEHVGVLDASAVDAAVVTPFLDSHKNWSPGTRGKAIRVIRRAWQWAIDGGKLTSHDLGGLKVPKEARRELIPDTAEIIALISASKPHLKELLMFIFVSGCRPGEAAMMERRHVSIENKEVRFKIGEDKTSGKTGKPRVIHLNSQAIDLIERILARGEPGRIFKMPNGNNWTRFSMGHHVQRTRERAGLSSDAVAYSLRHAWATDALASGVPLSFVAELMGNSPEIVARVYSHLSDRKQLLLDAAEQVRPAPGAVSAQE